MRLTELPYGVLQLRFGKAVKDSANTNIFEHAGRAFAVTENHLPYEINISNLSTLGPYSVNGAWNQPFTSHPKVMERQMLLLQTSNLQEGKGDFVLPVPSYKLLSCSQFVNLHAGMEHLIHIR